MTMEKNLSLTRAAVLVMLLLVVSVISAGTRPERETQRKVPGIFNTLVSKKDKIIKGTCGQTNCTGRSQCQTCECVGGYCTFWGH